MEKAVGNSPIQFLKLKSKGIIRFAVVPEIVYCEADDNYTLVVLNDQSQYTLCSTLKSFESRLGKTFFRCHKTYLVNMLYVKGINKKKHTVILKNGTELPFSRLIIRKLERAFSNCIYPGFNTVYPVFGTIQ